MKALATVSLVLLLTLSVFAQKKEDRTVESFNAISVAVPADVIITKGKNHKVVLQGDEEDLQEIETEVIGKRLKIGHENNNWWWGGNKRSSKVTIYITTPELTGISLSGSGNVTSKDIFTAEDFEADISGSGSLKLNIQAQETDLNVSGSGKIILNGKSDEAEINISGSGDIDAESFKVAEADIKIMGSGNCSIYVSERLDSKIMGSGNIRYAGNPKHVNNDSMGSGRIKKI